MGTAFNSSYLVESIGVTFQVGFILVLIVSSIDPYIEDSTLRVD